MKHRLAAALIALFGFYACSTVVLSQVVLEGPAVASNEAFIISQMDESAWTNIGFVESFSDPVVIPSVLTSNDADPAEVMLSEVTEVGVDVRSGEWEYQDGIHGDETVGLFLLDSGAHDLGGLAAVAGKVPVAGNLSRVDFGVEFSSVPVILAHLVSEKGDVTAVVSSDKGSILLGHMEFMLF